MAKQASTTNGRPETFEKKPSNRADNLQKNIDARYKKDYKITRNQLEYLARRVKLLQKLTKKICAAKIDSFI